MALQLRNDDLNKEPSAQAQQLPLGSDQVYGQGAPHQHPVGFPQDRRVHNTFTPGADNFGNSGGGGVAGIAYGVADRGGSVDAAHPGSLPPPPSQAHLAAIPRSLHSDRAGSYLRHGPNITSSIQSGDSAHSNIDYQPSGDCYQFYTNSVSNQPALGVLNDKDIIDDGHDSLEYGHSQRASTRSAASLGHAPGAGARGAAIEAAAAGGAVIGGLHRGALQEKDGNQLAEYDLHSGQPAQDPSAAALAKEQSRKKRKKWIIIIIAFLIIAGAIVGGVVGGLINNSKKGGKEAPAGSRGGSSSGGTGKGGGNGGNGGNHGAGGGGLAIHSPEIQSLLGNKKLSKVFPGMDYTPLNTQYPACLTDPPSQDDITKDVAVLSQLTNKIRLYGTDCNQTEMVLYAINQLGMKDTIKVWLGVWQDNNSTTNQRQLDQMWTILDDYGSDPFEGIIVANEALFREQFTITTLGALLDDVRTKVKAKNLNLPVATSDLGDNWKAALASASDLIMANVHPFFSGQPADKAAAWTWNFWHDHDGPFWKADNSMNVIAETGWPSGGGTDCGGPSTCTGGAVAGIDEMNRFMDDWVCQALENGTNYFWFEAFDEPWKVQYNTPGMEWEDKWGLMDADRNLKDGIKIPTCGGKTVD